MIIIIIIIVNRKTSIKVVEKLSKYKDLETEIART